MMIRNVNIKYTVPKKTVNMFRSIHQGRSIKKDILENFAKFTGKHPYQSLFLNKVAGLAPATLSKKRLWHICFSVNFVKLLEQLFYRAPPGNCFCMLTSS